MENYEPETRIEIEDKIKVVSTLNKIKINLLDYYLDSNTITEMQKKYWHNIYRILEKTIQSLNLLVKLKCLEKRKNHDWKRLLPKE